MRVLLDECVDRRLGREITGHEVITTPEAGWAGLKNGELLSIAQDSFDVFVTTDRNLAFQHRTFRSSPSALSFCGPVPTASPISVLLFLGFSKSLTR